LCLQGLLVCDLLVLMGLIFYIEEWLGLFSMRLGFIVVYNIVGIGEIIGHGIGLACFLVWNLECYPVLGLCYYLGI
jgi:hypothetical protein